MNYQRIYDEFISDRLGKFEGNRRARHKGRERHHIKPKCVGGGEKTSNFISLTPADHLFAHLLLARIHGGKLLFAFVFMLNHERYQGRRSRLRYESLLQASRNFRSTLPAHNKGKPIHPNSKAALDKLAAERLGKPPHPNSLAALLDSGAKGTHPNSLKALRDTHQKRKGKPRHPNFEAASIRLAEEKRGKPMHPNMRSAAEKVWERNRGKPNPKASETCTKRNAERKALGLPGPMTGRSATPKQRAALLLGSSSQRGKTQTEDHKRKNSEAVKRAWAKRKGIPSPLKGGTWSPERRARFDAKKASA